MCFRVKSLLNNKNYKSNKIKLNIRSGKQKTKILAIVATTIITRIILQFNDNFEAFNLIN